MLLFIILFFASLIVVGATAVLGFSFYLKRRTKRLRAENQPQFNPPPPSEYRSLFAPTDEELRADELEDRAAQKAKADESARLKAEEKLKAFTDFKRAWLARPERKNTIELLQLAVESESAETFSETASLIIELWREGQIENLSARDLADLLDSHLRTLPQQERNAGALFWLREKTAKLRAGVSEEF